MSIFYDNRTRTFYLDGKSMTYAFCINDAGYAEHLYFGKRIPHDSLLYSRARGAGTFLPTRPGKDGTAGYQVYPSELTFFGNSDYREPCVQVQNIEGDRLCELLYDGHTVLENKPPINGMPSMDGGETLVLHLKDTVSDFAADLYYTVYDDADVIARRIVYRNGGANTVLLRRAYSFSLSLPRNDYEVVSLYGVWAKERHMQRIPMHHGVVSIDSKRASSSAVLNPFMAVVSTDTTETVGEAWGINLVYSSSFVLKVQGVPDGTTLLTGGINDFDFSWKLAAGEAFETPEVVIAFSAEGLGGMSRELHRAYRNHLINKRFVNATRPLLINNWEGTYFDFNTDKLKAIVDAVEGTGIDTFVLDDGWFGKRNSDTAGLGDWFVNLDKLEGGLKPIADHVHAKGMKFGLWFEPEMVNEDSELFRAHPDYAIGVPSRERCYTRHQFMLDLTRAEVRDYIVDSVNRVLRECDIDYVKWDYNRNVTEFFMPGRDADEQTEFAHRYALGVYDLCERIIEANPRVFFEGCSGGGARFDPAMLYYFPQIWTSDDTDADERTKIQYGTSLAYPLSAMSCHVSTVPNHQTRRTEVSLKTRAHIAGLGATGYELDSTHLTEEEKAEIRQYNEAYRRDHDLILQGDLYRVEDPFSSNYFTVEIISPDKRRGLLTTYRRVGSTNNDEIKRLRFVGLDPEMQYRLPELELTLSGAVLMNIGIVPDFGWGDFKSLQYHFEAE